jgi:hypothetical protein
MAYQSVTTLGDLFRLGYITWGGKMSERRVTWPAEMFGGEAGKQVPIITGNPYGIYINDLEDNDMYIVLPAAGCTDNLGSKIFAFEDDDKLKVTHVKFLINNSYEWIPIEEKDTYYSSRHGAASLVSFMGKICGKSSWVRVSTLLKPVIKRALRNPPPGAPTEAQKAAAERRSTYRSTQTGGKLRKRKHKNTRRR